MLDKKPRFRVSTIVTVVLSAAIFIIAGWLFLNRQYVMDQVSVWAYDVPANVAAIDERVGFHDKGTFYFYASHPVVADAKSFNDNCPRREVASPILGCYGMSRIHIFDVTNPQLEGIEEVTAAHEMLHAAWDRLPESERQRIGSLLEKVYLNISDEAFKERIAYYERTQPGEFYNELHSIIPTEVASIGNELEEYYTQYFEDRSVVVAFHDQYEAVFGELESRANTLSKELSQLGASITERTDQYNADAAQLSADIESFNNRASNNGFDSMSQFNNERAALVARSNQLTQERTSINKDILRYNTKYEQYQAVAAQIEFLNKSIDSIDALDPSPTL